MVSNRSAPTAGVLPRVACRRLERAIARLAHAFSFAENFRTDGHHWLFPRHAMDLSPDERGAIICARRLEEAS